MATFVLQGGYYDLSRKKDLENELQSVVCSGDVTLDLRKTESFDCSCLSVLLLKLQEWRKENAHLRIRLINVFPILVKMLTILQLDSIFIIESKRDDN